MEGGEGGTPTIPPRSLRSFLMMLITSAFPSFSNRRSPCSQCDVIQLSTLTHVSIKAEMACRQLRKDTGRSTVNPSVITGLGGLWNGSTHLRILSQFYQNASGVSFCYFRGALIWCTARTVVYRDKAASPSNPCRAMHDPRLLLRVRKFSAVLQHGNDRPGILRNAVIWPSIKPVVPHL